MNVNRAIQVKSRLNRKLNNSTIGTIWNSSRLNCLILSVWPRSGSRFDAKVHRFSQFSCPKVWNRAQTRGWIPVGGTKPVYRASEVRAGRPIIEFDSRSGGS